MNLSAVETLASPLPDVAVIVPCYNYSRFLRGCVKSILDFTNLNVRVIILDDCSTDDTPDVCAELSRENPAITVIRHEYNRGHIETYNHGLRLAKANYIHLISADDELMPFALDRAVAIMTKHPDVGMVYGRTVQGTVSVDSVRNSDQPAYSIVQGSDWIEARCRDGRNPIYSPEVTLKSVVAHAVGAYDARLPLAADLEMWLRVAARSSIAIIENVDQAFYRTHSQSMHLGHAKEGFFRGLRERMQAYELFFECDGHLLLNALSLQHLARTCVARDALRRARLAYDLGQQNVEILVSAIEFAEAITTDTHKIPEWGKVKKRISKGSSQSFCWKILVSFLARVCVWYEWQLKNRDLGHKGLEIIYSGRLPLS